jgi:hypothetical protein
MNSLNLKDIIKKILLEAEEIPASEEENPEETPEEEQPQEPEQEEEPEQPQEKPEDNPEFPNRTISKQEAAKIIKSTKGKYFTVSFTKKDGTNRVMNARLGVKVYLKGGTLPYNPDEKGLIPVFDAKIKGYRMVNINTINKLVVDKVEYDVK